MDTHSSIQNLVELEQVMPLLKDIGVCSEDVLCSDSPDIHIPNFKGRYIGIEVTECHTIDIATNKKQQIKRCESRLNAICRNYGKKCSIEGRSVNVSLEFSSLTHTLLQKKKVDKCIEQKIFDEIERHRTTDYICCQIYDERWEALNNAKAFNYQYVTSATFFEPPLNGVVVSYCEGRGIKCIEKEYITHCINEKETKLTTYKSKNPHIEEFWLCIAVDYLEFRSIDKCPQYEGVSNYDRIYLTLGDVCQRIK